MLLEYHGLGLLDLRGGRRERELEEQLVRLESGEPIQYVLGSVEWCGMKIGVEPGVLIPRPETEEMVQMLGSRVGKRGTTTRILDLCTGSGCIALAMKQKFPEAYVEGWDISDKALSIAKKNAETLNLDVEFRKVDVLQFKGSSRGFLSLFPIRRMCAKRRRRRWTEMCWNTNHTKHCLYLMMIRWYFTEPLHR